MSIEIGCAISSDVVDQPFEFDKLGVHSSAASSIPTIVFLSRPLACQSCFSSLTNSRTWQLWQSRAMLLLPVANALTMASAILRAQPGIAASRVLRVMRFGGHVEITHGRANVAAQKQMEAALVSFNDSAFVNRADGLSKLFFKFDKLGVMGSTAQLRLRFLLLLFLSRPLVCQNCFSSLTNSV